MRAHRGSARVCAQTLHSNRGDIIVNHSRQRPSNKPGWGYVGGRGFFLFIISSGSHTQGERKEGGCKQKDREEEMFSILPPRLSSAPLHSALSLLLPSHAPFVWLFFSVSFPPCSLSLSLPFRSAMAAAEMYNESKWNFR